MLMECILEFNLDLIWEIRNILPTIEWLVLIPTISIHGNNVQVDSSTISDTLEVPKHYNYYLSSKSMRYKLRVGYRVLGRGGSSESGEVV